MPARPEVVVFDVNETLSDQSALRERFSAAGLPGDLMTAWFASTLRDGFAMSIAGQAAGFAALAADALRTIAHGRSDLDVPVEDLVSDVLTTFQNLDVHPDVPGGLRALHDGGLRLVTLSNGSVSVAEGLLERAGLADLVEQRLSVEEVGQWKPARAAYQLAADRCGVALGEMALVAVHPWDTHGAQSAGMTGAWVNRGGAPFPSSLIAPDVAGSDLGAVAQHLLALG